MYIYSIIVYILCVYMYIYIYTMYIYIDTIYTVYKSCCEHDIMMMNSRDSWEVPHHVEAILHVTMVTCCRRGNAGAP